MRSQISAPARRRADAHAESQRKAPHAARHPGTDETGAQPDGTDQQRHHDPEAVGRPAHEDAAEA